MAPDPGSTDDDRRPPDGAAGSATDRARIDYLTGDRDVRLTAADQAELLKHRCASRFLNRSL